MALFDSLVVLTAHPPPKADGPTNMALDETLFSLAGRSSLRLYAWDRPAVTLGYFQSHSAMAEAFPGFALTRRWTGGGAVQHGDPRECTYALGVPRAEAFAHLRPQEAYVSLHGIVRDALRDVGVEAALVEVEGPQPAASHFACFEGPVLGDVILPSGRKLAGAAQRRTRRGLLIQGSIRLAEPIPERFRTAFAKRLCRDVTPLDPAILPAARVEDLIVNKYGRASWLHRVP